MKEIKYVDLPHAKLKRTDGAYTSLLSNYLDKSRVPLLFITAAAVASVHIAINVCNEIEPNVNLSTVKENIRKIATSICWDVNETFVMNVDLFKSQIEVIINRLFPEIKLNTTEYKSFDSVFGAMDSDEALNKEIENNSWHFSSTITKIRELYQPKNVMINEYLTLTTLEKGNSCS